MYKLIIKGKSYAKINIGLNVIGFTKRDFVLLDTIIVPINKLYDEIEIYETDNNEDEVYEIYKNQITPRKLVSSHNTFQALKKIKELTNNKRNYKIKIWKNIQLGSGLGGTSGNVAFVMEQLNNLAKNPLEIKRLINEGAKISLDAACFLVNGPVRVMGKGDTISLLDFNPLNYLKIEIIAIPYVSSTSKVYHHYKKTKSTSYSNIDEIIWAIKNQKSSYLKNHLKNDLTETILELYPEINKEYQKYSKKEGIIIFTGSGSYLLRINELKHPNLKLRRRR